MSISISFDRADATLFLEESYWIQQLIDVNSYQRISNIYQISTAIPMINKLITPCPISPNIIPNRNGKVITVNKAGFISPYLGNP